jgi:hypothetical protein
MLKPKRFIFSDGFGSRYVFLERIGNAHYYLYRGVNLAIQGFQSKVWCDAIELRKCTSKYVLDLGKITYS